MVKIRLHQLIVQKIHICRQKVASNDPPTRLALPLCVFAAIQLLIVGNAMGQTARLEIHSLDTLTLTDAQFLTGSKSGTPARIGFELRFPIGNGPFPSVVLLHSCGGVGANVNFWAQELNNIGVAAANTR